VTPSRGARALLRLLLPPDLRDDVAANLDDLYAAKARRLGPWRARLWYWHQAVSFPIRLRLSGTVPARELSSTRTAIMRSILQDLRYAWRVHRARPAVAVVAVLSLAVGIGLNTAIFSVVHGVLLRPVPIADLDRVVMIWQTDRDTGTTREPGSLPDFLDYRARSRTFAAMGALLAGEVNIQPAGGEPMRLAQLRVTDDLLAMLGIRPRVGRTIQPADTTTGAEPVALISDALWTRAFARDPSVAGRRLVIDEIPHTVIGVVDDATDFGVLQVLGQAAYSRSFADRGAPIRVDVWAPLPSDPNILPRSTHPLFIVGRLAPGAPIDAAREEMTRIAAELEAEFPADNAARGVNLEPLGEVVFGPVRPALYALVGAVALVLLVACVNVANLMLARGTARQREVAVRLALGAGRGRVVRQFLTESVALSLVAGGLGVLLAYGVVQWLAAAGPAEVPRLATASIDPVVLAMTVVVSLAAGVLFGIVPALQAGSAAPRAALGEAGRAASGSRRQSRLRDALVIAELALAVVLVVGAGLLIRSVWNLQAIDPGFRAAGVVKAEVTLPRTRYPVSFAVWPDFKQFHAFTTALEQRAASLPGVASVAVAGNHPLDPGFTNSFAIVGREAESGAFPEISVRRVTPGYFETVGLAVTSGRALDATDTTAGAPVLLINDAAAARFFPDRSPIGHAIGLWGANRRIVGTVADERFQGLTGDRPLAVYLPLGQAPSTNGQAVLLVRTERSDPAALGPSLARAVRDVDPQLAVFGIETLDQTKARSIAEERFTMLLLGLFAALALGLAAVGIHGVLSYSVTERAREIGIRLALGAHPARLRRSVVAQGLALAATGLVIGAVGALLLTRALQSLLHGVTPADPLTFGAVVCVLAAVAALASYLPARRVTRVDPKAVLRVEG
jgi:predicted permease